MQNFWLKVWLFVRWAETSFGFCSFSAKILLKITPHGNWNWSAPNTGGIWKIKGLCLGWCPFSFEVLLRRWKGLKLIVFNTVLKSNNCFRSYNNVKWGLVKKWIVIKKKEKKKKVQLAQGVSVTTGLQSLVPLFRLHVLESENMRMSTLIRTTNRQVDVRLNEIELQLGADSESEEISLEEEEKNQESFI